MRTFETFSFKYGRLEVRAKLPRGDWLWPAVWLLPKHEQYGPWPASGEIDFMEARGNANKTSGPNQIGSTLHWGPSQQENPWDIFHEEYVLTDGTDFADDYHIFGLYWDEDEIYTYVDTDENKVLVAKINETFWEKGLRQRPHWQKSYTNPWAASKNVNAPYDQEFYIVMNLAVGGCAPPCGCEPLLPAALHALSRAPSALCAPSPPLDAARSPALSLVADAPPQHEWLLQQDAAAQYALAPGRDNRPGAACCQPFLGCQGRVVLDVEGR